MCLSTSCIHLVSYVRSPWWPLHNFLRLCCFNIRISPAPLGSQQLPACIWFQYLGFPCLSTTSCAHLFLISNFPPLPLIRLPKLPAFIGFQHLYYGSAAPPSPCDTLGFPPPSHSALFFSISTLHTSVPHLGAFTWLQYLNSPPLCLSPISCIHSLGLKTSPLAS